MTLGEGTSPIVEYVHCILKSGFQILITSHSIVAIHGLNGHREKTWTASNNILWLRDLLPKDIPNARIFSWGYDANTHSTSHLSAQYLYGHARTLVSDLSRKRRVTKVLAPDTIRYLRH
jgi:hypothetical protein